MSLRRMGWVAAIALATLLEISCGQIYRPVVIPINVVNPNPQNFHAVFAIAANVPYTPGTAFQIDVSGDSDIGQANMGMNPTHAAVLPNNSRVFVASAGSLFTGDTDVITAFYPAGDSSTASGLGTTTTFTLPNVGPSQQAGVLSISESANVVTMNISAPLINAQVGSTIVVSAVLIPVGTLPAPGCTNPPAPTGYDGNFSISSVSANGTTIQFSDPISCLTPISSPGGTAIIPVPLFCSYLPDFVATSQNNAVYIANYGVEGGQHCTLSSTDSVMEINATNNTISNTVYLPAGTHPVAMVEPPNGQNLYVLSQSTSTVFDLSPTDLTTLATIPVGNTPAWAATRPDSQRVYVVTQGDGNLYTINTATNAVIPGSPQAVGGPGANYVVYDSSLNRLYVTNPTAGQVFVFDATTDPPTPLCALGAQGITCPTGIATTGISVPLPPNCTSTTCSPVMPTSVAALQDGSRFYVASYATALPGVPCPDLTQTAAGCVIPQVTVFDALSLTVKTTVFPLLPVVATTTGTTTTFTYPYALAPTPFCAPAFPQPYTPASARFRMSAAAAVGSSRVYASLCDSGNVAVINTTTSTTATGGTNTPDILVTDLPAPFSAAAVSSGEPAPQNPVFLLTGQ
jgi:DNA-binding beta-propeller fold protein YncE